MHIIWNHVTRVSQWVAIILFVAVFGVGFWLGMFYKAQAPASSAEVKGAVISDVAYACDEGKTIHALFYEDRVTLSLSDGRTLNLPHVISASGARYANEDESLVFWEKGPTAFITENGDKGSVTTYASCEEAPR